MTRMESCCSCLVAQDDSLCIIELVNDEGLAWSSLLECDLASLSILLLTEQTLFVQESLECSALSESLWSIQEATGSSLVPGIKMRV